MLKKIFWKNVRKMVKFLADNEEENFKNEMKLRDKREKYKLSDEQFKEFVGNYSDKLKDIVYKNTDRNILKYKSRYEDYLKHLDNVYNNIKNTDVKSEMDIQELFKFKHGNELIKDDIDKYNDLINSSVTINPNVSEDEVTEIVTLGGLLEKRTW